MMGIRRRHDILRVTGTGSQETVVLGQCLTQMSSEEKSLPLSGLNFLMYKIREVVVRSVFLNLF